jgi:PKD repeat protein
MKARDLVLALPIGLALVLALLLTLAAGAQEPQLAADPQRGGTHQPPSYVQDSDDARAFPRPVVPGNQGAQSVNAPTTDLGQPGLSFRYVGTFGETEVAYFDDSSHLNGPQGVGTDGTHVWIAECEGRRALKYAADGIFQTQVGDAGFRYGTGTTLECLSDVAVDGSGNTWVVDGGAQHVIKFDSSGSRVSELGVPFGWGSDNDHFADPSGITFDGSSNIYISDSANHRIQVFDSSATYLTTLGVTGVSGVDNGHLNYPGRIVVDSNNRLYIADTGNHRVQIFNVANPLAIDYLGTIGVSGVSGSDNAHFDAPEGVAVDLAKNRIYVADGYNERVQVFNYTTRAYQQTLDGFSYVSDVAVDSAGHLYVAEPWSKPSDVQQFDSNLKYLQTFGTAGVPYITDGYHYHQPCGVAVAPDGSLYVGESRGRRLVKLDAAGTPLWSRGEPGIWGDDNDLFTYVEDVDLDAAGRVYTVDRSNCRVQIYNSGGSYYDTLGTGCGTGNDQFDHPYGVAVGPDGKICVADTNNQRVQVFDSNRTYLATLGVTGVPGSDNGHFAYPRDVDVDDAGNIYVADQDNHRVQVFDSNRTYVRTIGESGMAGDDFGHLDSPTAVTVDAEARIYVADGWGYRVQVFDSTGDYLTTVGGGWGWGSGDLRDAEGLAVDAAGNLYVAERENHRIQKFARGVPGGRQVNINGFGDPYRGANTLGVFDGQLYAGGDGIWRTADGHAWTTVVLDGFGAHTYVDSFAVLSDSLYLGTGNSWDGAAIYRSADGLAWTNVVTAGFGFTSNIEIINMTVHSDHLYAAVLNYDTGGQIWTSPDGLKWTQAISDNFGSGSTGWWTFEEFNGQLYVGLEGETGGLLYGTDGDAWTPITTDGFGDQNNGAIPSLAAFKEYLYAGTRNMNDGAQVWRSSTGDAGSWTKVATGGFGDPANGRGYGLIVAGNYLYFVITNTNTGDQVWRTPDGTSWEHVGVDGWGDSNSIFFDYSDKGAAVFYDRLYICGYGASGGKVWKKTVTADFTASPTIGPPPLQVGFTNTSVDDFTTSLWDFGDGATTTDTNPVHTYNLGVYDVVLTVSDGIDTSTITRTAYIRVMNYVYLPLVLRKYGTVLYDSFDNSAFDDSYNPALWLFSGESFIQARQLNGNLVFSNATAPAAGGANLIMLQPGERSWQQLQQFEARLKISSDQSGDYAFVKLQISSGDIAGHGWWTQCRLGAWAGGSQPTFVCDVATHQGGSINFEYTSVPVAVSHDAWYRARIETNPSTAEMRFYLDSTLVGTYTPNDALYLVLANSLQPQVGVWNDAAGTRATRYVDDVRITSALP